MNNNKRQVWLYGVNNNVWDAGNLIGGNYWSDYNGIDSEGDNIGDTPYIIDSDTKDNYPLMQPWIILPSEVSPISSVLYLITGIGTIVIVLVICIYLLKHRKRSFTVGKIRHTET